MSSSSFSKHEPSVSVSHVFPNVSEDRVREVFYALNIARISRVVMTTHTSRDGKKFKSVVIHFDKWFETETAVKARATLLAGNELSIIYNNPWFWKVFAIMPKPNPVVSRPPPPSNIRIEYATNTPKDDPRTYRERRNDPKLCEQDVKSGFKDRRIVDDCDEDIDLDELWEAEQRRRQRRQRNLENKEKEAKEAKRVKEELEAKRVKEESEAKEAKRIKEKKVKEESEANAKLAPPIVMNPEMVIRMRHSFMCEITPEIYRANIMNVRDQMEYERERDSEQYIENRLDDSFDYGPRVEAPKKKSRTIIQD